MWWSYLLVGCFQLLVCFIFAEVVSEFPISGGLYPWARRLVGKRWAWMTGWIYAWALCATIAAVATGGAPFFAALLGVNFSPQAQTTIAIAMIGIVTALNLSGTRLLARVAMFGFICELVGALLVGSYLLVMARHHSLSVLFDTSVVSDSTSYSTAFAGSAVAAMFCYYGFEACGDVAEETPNAGRVIPKAMCMTVYVGGGAAMFVCLALILAVPDLPAVLAGKVQDPVADTLTNAFGMSGFRAVIAIVLVSFASCLLSLQAAASRLLFAYGRDKMIVASDYLSRLSARTHVPNVALLVVGLIPALFALVGIWLGNAIATIISFASAGIYLAFQLLVLGALIARTRGWRPSGSFRLGYWAIPVNVIAFLYGICAIVDMLWPRTPQDPWYSNYGMIIGTVAIVSAGLLYMFLARPYDHGESPAGDAHLMAYRPEIEALISRDLPSLSPSAGRPQADAE